MGANEDADLKDKKEGKASDEEATRLQQLKGKGKAVEQEEEEDDDADEDEEDFDEEADDEGSDDGDEAEDDEEADDEEEEAEEKPPTKRKASGSEAGPSTKKKKKPSGGGGDDEEEESEPEIVKGLSGDEVDQSLIIAGGRRSRRGRPQFGSSGSKYKYESKDDSDDEW